MFFLSKQTTQKKNPMWWSWPKDFFFCFDRWQILYRQSSWWLVTYTQSKYNGQPLWPPLNDMDLRNEKWHRMTPNDIVKNQSKVTKKIIYQYMVNMVKGHVRKIDLSPSEFSLKWKKMKRSMSKLWLRFSIFYRHHHIWIQDMIVFSTNNGIINQSINNLFVYFVLFI